MKASPRGSTCMAPGPGFPGTRRRGIADTCCCSQLPPRAGTGPGAGKARAAEEEGAAVAVERWWQRGHHIGLGSAGSRVIVGAGTGTVVGAGIGTIVGVEFGTFVGVGIGAILASFFQFSAKPRISPPTEEFGYFYAPRSPTTTTDHRPPPTTTATKSSQVKIYSPEYIEQCAAGPSCPVRGVVGCKRCSSSVSCVG